MASRIAGITIEIGGDTSKLTKALKGVDSQLKTTQSNLKDIDKLLKLNPGNVELLTQKQKNLKEAISLTKDRLTELRKAQDGVQEGTAEWDALQREIIATEQSLRGLEKDMRAFGSVTAQQIKAAGAAVQNAGAKIESVGQKLKGISTAAGAVGTALLKLGYDSVTSADELNTLSQQTGLTTDELQKMQYASELVDVSLEDMTGAMRKLKTKVDPTNKTLKDLGVAVVDDAGNLRDVNMVFYDTLLALSKIDNETERDQIAMELFGKSADSLAGIIDDGGKSLRAYGKEAEELGLIMDKETISSLNDTNDELSRMKGLIKGSLGKLGATIAKTVAPAVEKLSKKFGEWSKKLEKLNPKTAETILKILGVVAAIAPCIIVIGKLVKGIGSVITIVGTVVGVLGGPLTIAIAAVIAAGVLLYKNWDKIKAVAITLKDSLIKTWNNVKTSVVNTVNNVKTSVVNAWNNIKTTVTNTVTNIKTSVVNTWNSLKTSVVNTVNSAKTSVVNTWNTLKTSVTTTVTNIKTSVTDTWTKLKTSVSDTAENLKKAVVDKIDGMKKSVTDAWSNLKSSVVETASNLKKSVQEKIEGLVEKIKEIFDFDWNMPTLNLPSWEDLKKKFEGIIEKIKKLFDFEWSLPHIKIPHFNISGGKWPYGLGGEGEFPSITVDWYKRAYDNPVMFTSPTVLPTANGMKGFGDGHGAEIVMGLNKLQELVGASGVTINVYAEPGMNVDELANKIQARFVALNKQRRLAHA